MRIVHFTLGSVDPDSLNGINRVIEGLAKTMNHTKMAEVSVITVRQKMQGPGRNVFQRDGFTVTACHSTNEALRLLAEIREQIDLVHLHNAWSVPNVRIGAWLVQQGIPYIITPHAAFLPDRMTRKTWIKTLFHKFIQKRLLDRAAALIAVSRDEMASISQFTSNPHIKFVQNGTKEIDRQKYQTNSRNQNVVTVGYLGRIGREKNIQTLVKAVHLLPVEIQSRLRVQVFGDANTDYGQKCQRLALSLGVAKTIKFCGKVSATDKWDILGTLDAYIQPSLSEAASIAVLEAIAMGLPIVATRTSGISYWHGQPFVTMVEPISVELALGLEELVLNPVSLQARGARAREFYEQNFTLDIVAKRQAEIYHACMTKA